MPKMAMEAIESLDLMKYVDAERDKVESYNAGVPEDEKIKVNLHKIPEIADNKDAIIEQFIKIFDRAISEAKDMLIERFEYICAQPAASAKFMYENGTMEGYDGKDVRSALKHGTLAVGQIALAETLQILIGCDHTTDEGMELAQRIEKLAFDRCNEFKEKYRLNFGVYYTPKHRYHWVA